MMIYVIYIDIINFKSVPRIKPEKAPNIILKHYLYFHPPFFRTYKCSQKGPNINPIPGIKKNPIIKPRIEPFIVFFLLQTSLL